MKFLRHIDGMTGNNWIGNKTCSEEDGIKHLLIDLEEKLLYSGLTT
jgi:hypothetical protein